MNITECHEVAKNLLRNHRNGNGEAAGWSLLTQADAEALVNHYCVDSSGAAKANITEELYSLMGELSPPRWPLMAEPHTLASTEEE